MLPACRTAGEPFALPQFALTRSDIETWLMLDSRVIDVRIVYTHHIPCPNPCQESNVAGQYQESG